MMFIKTPTMWIITFPFLSDALLNNLEEKFHLNFTHRCHKTNIDWNLLLCTQEIEIIIPMFVKCEKNLCQDQANHFLD